MHLLIFKDSTFAQMRDWTRFKELKTLAVKPALGFDTPEDTEEGISCVLTCHHGPRRTSGLHCTVTKGIIV